MWSIYAVLFATLVVISVSLPIDHDTDEIHDQERLDNEQPEVAVEEASQGFAEDRVVGSDGEVNSEVLLRSKRQVFDGGANCAQGYGRNVADICMPCTSRSYPPLIGCSTIAPLPDEDEEDS